MEVKITRSKKRKTTVSGRLVDETMYVNAPADMPEAKVQEIIDSFKKRFEKRKLKKELNRKENLMDICQKLNQQYFNGEIEVKSIEYSTEQTRKWGVCNSKNKTIRISHRLTEMPDWVKNYVIVHEMAHILQPNHSKKFWKKVRRYKLSERARGYLIAKGYEDADETDLEENQESSQLLMGLDSHLSRRSRATGRSAPTLSPGATLLLYFRPASGGRMADEIPKWSRRVRLQSERGNDKKDGMITPQLRCDGTLNEKDAKVS